MPYEVTQRKLDPPCGVHWVACGTCSVPGNFFQVGGSLRPFIIWLVFVADITRALIVTEL